MAKKKEVSEQIDFSFLGIIKHKCTNPGKESFKQFKEAIGFSKWITGFIGILVSLIIAALIIWGPKMDPNIYTAAVSAVTTSAIGGITRYWLKSRTNRSP